MEVELEWLRRVVRRHCPAFYIHPSDKFLPCTFEHLMAHSELRAEVEAGCNAHKFEVLLPRGSVNGQQLAEVQQQQQQQQQGRRLWLELDPAVRQGEAVERLDSVPVYAHPKLVCRPNGNADAIEIVYLMCFAYNGPYKLGVLPITVPNSAHDGDFEHLTVRVHPTSGALQGVYYNSHRSRDGTWLAAAEVPRCPQSGRIAAYLALHGHGTYPAPGRVLRHFFLGNDLCSADGPMWRPRQVVLLPPLDNPAAAAANCGSLRCRLAKVPTRGCLLPHIKAGSPADEGEVGSSSSSSSELPEVLTDGDCTWVLFRGRWGKADAPCEQSWMKGAEPPVSRTPLQRLFCHFLPETQSVAAG